MLVIAAFVSIRAWDDTGHKLSARIAWEVMTPAARERASQLLKAAPENSDLSVIYNAFDGRSEDVRRLELFMYASTWPDVVRNRDFKVRYETYHKSNWHYADFFFGEDGKIIKDFPEPSGVAIPKLKDFEHVFRSETTTEGDKAVAIAWFLHVAGDIHNPLHNASRVTDLEPKGDQGGNLFYLEPARDDGSWRLNLHSFWDSQITRNIPRRNDACDADYLEPIAAVQFALHPVSSFDLKLGSYKEWSREGFDLLPGTVYGKGLKRDSLPDEEYRTKAFRIAMERLALAGYRIGKTLNSAFDPSAQ